jgi:hypothetical protein
VNENEKDVLKRRLVRETRLPFVARIDCNEICWIKMS